MHNYVVETTVEYKTRRNSLVMTTRQFIPSDFQDTEEDILDYCKDDILRATQQLEKFYTFDFIDDCDAEIKILSQKVTRL